jgi:hypothetical protein
VDRGLHILVHQRQSPLSNVRRQIVALEELLDVFADIPQLLAEALRLTSGERRSWETLYTKALISLFC